MGGSLPCKVLDRDVDRLTADKRSTKMNLALVERARLCDRVGILVVQITVHAAPVPAHL